MKLLASLIFGLIGWFVGVISSGLIWDEFSHQLKRRGIMQRICHILISFSAVGLKKEARANYIQAVLPDIEELIVDKRHFVALKISFNIAFSEPFRPFLVQIVSSVIITFIAISKSMSFYPNFSVTALTLLIFFFAFWLLSKTFKIMGGLDAIVVFPRTWEIASIFTATLIAHGIVYSIGITLVELTFVDFGILLFFMLSAHYHRVILIKRREELNQFFDY